VKINKPTIILFKSISMSQKKKKKFLLEFSDFHLTQSSVFSDLYFHLLVIFCRATSNYISVYTVMLQRDRYFRYSCLLLFLQVFQFQVNDLFSPFMMYEMYEIQNKENLQDDESATRTT
jgi:hypothetical protein